MDFLDPKKKQAHRRRLFIGYILMFVAVALGALILLFSAYGYDVDRKTGAVIQNGIIFVDTKPAGASIVVNGETQSNRAPSRLVLPSGSYAIRLELDGYRSWNRTVLLEGGVIERLVYPLLIPKTLKPTDLELYGAAPNSASVSLDKRWLLINVAGQQGAYELFDLTQPNSSAVPIQVPAAILSDAAKPSNYTVVDWASDNRHVLLDRTYENLHEFILLDRELPASSINLSKLFGVAVTSAQFRNKKFDQLYLFDANGGIVRTADVKAKSVSSPLLNNVITFKTFNDNLVFYITAQSAPAGKVAAHILRDDKDYVLRNLPANSPYLLDFAQYDGHWYYAAGAVNDDTIYVYRDPLDDLSLPTPTPLSVAAIIRNPSPQYLSLSPNFRFITVQSANNLVTYDTEADRQFKYILPQAIAATDKLKWIDGYRLSFSFGSEVYIVDFDGSNLQDMGKIASPAGGPFFDRDFNSMFTISPSISVPTRTGLVRTPLTLK